MEPLKQGSEDRGQGSERRASRRQPAVSSRRRFLHTGVAVGGASWLTTTAHLLAEQEAVKSKREPAQSIIYLRLAGGPSQLETFDPHPGRLIAGDTQAVETRIKGVQLAAGLPQVAEHLDCATLVRNVVSKEGDHERGSYVMRTGYRPDATLVHPAIGAIACHQLPIAGCEIPRHIAIFPDRFPPRGGFLGTEYDAFKTFDPKDPVPDVRSYATTERTASRLEDLDVVESAFAQGRRRAVDATLHRRLFNDARTMMTSDQLQAFNVRYEPQSVQAAYGDTPFGRGCLAARRLVDVGVRCVEVVLSGWDSHAKNHEIQNRLCATLDPALAALLHDLRTSGRLDRTLVVCGGEFGRTPKINRAAGRDHWPSGFSLLLAGGGLRRGYVHGETDPDGAKLTPEQGVSPADLHATLLSALGIDPHREIISPIGRPIKLADGAPLDYLLG